MRRVRNEAGPWPATGHRAARGRAPQCTGAVSRVRQGRKKGGDRLWSTHEACRTV